MRVPLVGQNTVVDIGRVLDENPLSLFQLGMVILAATSITFDGLGVQLIGYALPRMAHQWGVPSTAFAPAVTAGLVGMAVGSASAGLLADNMGRRWALIASVLFFGVATMCVGLAHGIASVAVFRCLAGVGIGGALPTSTTFVAEFTPTRIRTVVVTCTIVCVPLGGMLAGLIAEAILPSHGWAALFIAGGAIPVVLSLVLFFLLHETPRFLVRQPKRWPELERILSRMRYPVAPGAQFIDTAERQTATHARFSSILTGDLRRETLCLWAAFLVSLFTIYMAFSWLPAILVGTGFTPAQASFGLAAYNASGVAGAVVCSLVIARYGSRWALILCCLGGALPALAALQPAIATHFPLLTIAITVHGFFVNAVQSTLYALGAFLYPTPVRARGAASASTFGRLGAILAGIAGAFVVSPPFSKFFLLIAGAMFIVLVSLAVLRRHIPPAYAKELQTGDPR